MSRTVAAYQPQYLPRLHYLARAAQADVFVIYDNAQLARRSPQHRAQIKRGEPVYITIPVSRDSEDTLLRDVHIELNTPWPVEHLSLIRERYETAAHELEPFFESIVPPVFDITRDDIPMCDKQVSEQVRTVTELDRQWRSKKSKLDNYKHERNCLQTRIASESGSEKEALILEATELKQEINALESEVQAIKRDRDTALVGLGQTIQKRHKEDAQKYLLDSSKVWDKIDTEVINSQPVTLTEFTIPLLYYLFDKFGIESEVVVASEVPVTRCADASEYLAQLTEYFNGTNYLSGKVGYEEYLDETIFRERGLDVSVQDWKPSWDRGNVCCLDVLYSSSDPGQYIR